MDDDTRMTAFRRRRAELSACPNASARGMMPPTMDLPHHDRRSLFSLHAAVLLFAAAGLFGKWLPLPSASIVAYRAAFACAALFIALWFRGLARSISAAVFIQFFYSGVILAIHWASFFASIKASTVAIGLITFSTYPLFITFIEPWAHGERLRAIDVLLATMSLVGVLLAIPLLNLADRFAVGAAWGMLSAFTFAVLTVVNRRLVAGRSAMVVGAWQNFFAALLLFALPATRQRLPNGHEWLLLAILGIGCTAVAHVLFIHALLGVRAQLAGVIGSLETLYGILLAALLLHEIPRPRTIIGGAVVVSAAILGTLARSRTPPPPLAAQS